MLASHPHVTLTVTVTVTDIHVICASTGARARTTVHSRLLACLSHPHLDQCFPQYRIQIAQAVQQNLLSHLGNELEHRYIKFQSWLCSCPLNLVDDITEAGLKRFRFLYRRLGTQI